MTTRPNRRLSAHAFMCMLALAFGILCTCAPAAFAYTDGDAPYEPNKNYRFSEDDINSAELAQLYDPANTVVPGSFDLRDRISIFVNDQDSLGLCDAFAITKCAETNYALTHGSAIDLSERYLDLMDSQKLYSDGRVSGILPTEENDWYSLEGDGTAYDDILTLLETFGAPTEEQVPFANYTDEQIAAMPKVKAAARVTSSVTFPSVLSIEDKGLKERWVNIVKTHIMKYGSVYSIIQIPEEDVNFNPETNAAYYKEGESTSGSGHAISIVGWDDSYPKENFLVQPSRNGAWIAVNSWGEEWGEGGFYYISYEDDDLLLQSAGVLATEVPTAYRTYTNSTKLDLHQHFAAEEDKRFLGMSFDTKGGPEKLSHLTVGVGGLAEDVFTSKVHVYLNPEDGTFDKDKLVLLEQTNSVAIGIRTNVSLATPIPLTGSKFALVFELVGDVDDFYLSPAKDASGEFLKGSMYYANSLDGAWATHDEEIAVFAFTVSEEDPDERIDAIAPEDPGAPKDQNESKGELVDPADEDPTNPEIPELPDPAVFEPDPAIEEPQPTSSDDSANGSDGKKSSEVRQDQTNPSSTPTNTGKQDDKAGGSAKQQDAQNGPSDSDDPRTSAAANTNKSTPSSAASKPSSTSSTGQTARSTAATGERPQNLAALALAALLLGLLCAVSARRAGISSSF